MQEAPHNHHTWIYKVFHDVSMIMCYTDEKRLQYSAEVPLDKAVGSPQSVLHREQSGLQCRGGSHAVSLGPEAAFSAHPPPASSSHGRVSRFGAQSASLQQVWPIQHSAATTPLVGCKQAAQTLLQLLSLFFWRLLKITARGGRHNHN